MNFNLYILGNIEGVHNQYPNDFTSSLLSNSNNELKGSKLIIHREMDLIHYVYMMRIDSKNTIGLAIVFNKIYSDNPHAIMSFLSSIIEEKLLKEGNIIKYNSNAKIEFTLNQFDSRINNVFDKIKDFCNYEFSENKIRYGLRPLNTIYNGVRSSYKISINSSNEDILSLCQRHNTVIIDSNNGIEGGYITKLIEALKKEKNEALKNVAILRDENQKLQKQKKQYKFVVFLSIIAVILGLSSLYLFSDLGQTRYELDYTQDMLIDANEDIFNKEILIDSIERENADLTDRVSNLSNANDVLQDSISKVERAFNDYVESLSDVQPFIVTGTNFNYSTGYLTFSYYAFKDINISLEFRVYGNDNYVTTERFQLSQGNGSNSIYLRSYFDKTKWHSFEILYNNKIIGGARQ